jgi:hypothetical protein
VAGEGSPPWRRPWAFPGLRHAGLRNLSVPVDRAFISSGPVPGPRREGQGPADPTMIRSPGRGRRLRIRRRTLRRCHDPSCDRDGPQLVGPDRGGQRRPKPRYQRTATTSTAGGKRNPANATAGVGQGEDGGLSCQQSRCWNAAKANATAPGTVSTSLLPSIASLPSHRRRRCCPHRRRPGHQWPGRARCRCRATKR